MNGDERNVLIFCRGSERYVWIWTDDRTSDALCTLGRFAAEPELSFSWYDACRVSQRMRETSEKVGRVRR